MTLSVKDQMGRRGENLAFFRLSEVDENDETPFFVPHLLGDKCPLFDILVELIDVGLKTPYFFVQVKTTRKGYNANRRLRVNVKKKDVVGMLHYPAPAYIIGIDDLEERAYIVSVFGNMSENISSLNTAHELKPATLKLLWEEVCEYWKDKDMLQKSSRFTN